MVICALLQASKSIFDRSSPRGQSRGIREFAEIFLAKNRYQNFGIFWIENAKIK
jgi:hypothetical protein